MKQHRRFAVILLLMPALLLSLFMYRDNLMKEKTQPSIKEGVLDLANWDKIGRPSFHLSGQWLLYPGKLLNIQEINDDHDESFIVKMPFSYKNMDISGNKLPKSDTATFRIRVINSPIGSRMAIRIRQLTAAYRLYIDGELIAQNGRMAENSPNPVSEYRFNTALFIPQKSSYDIIVQTANQYDTKGLFHWPVVLGDYDAIQKNNRIMYVIDYITVGAIIMLILSLLIFWLQMPKEKELMHLCIFGITILIRILINQDILIADILPDLSVLTLSNIDYTAVFAIQYLVPACILASYHDLYTKLSMRLILAYSSLLIVLTWAAPISMHSNLSFIFDWIMMIILIHTLIVLTRAAAEGRSGSGELLVLMSCVIALMFTSFQVTDSNMIYYLLSGSGLGYCIIIFVQCILLAKRFRDAVYLELSALEGQIRPHFIHNALATIITISRFDPDRSRELLTDFSSYLRGKFDYTNVEFIPIEQELELVRAYVALEKARFGDKYNVIYNLDAGDFLIPPLILQPLVENAFIHGLRGKEEGGTVTVYTVRRNKAVRIGVRDDGLGLVKNLQIRGRKGIGIDNINRRLRKLYGTQLQFITPKDGGFEVYLEIPYKEAIKNESRTG